MDPDLENVIRQALGVAKTAGRDDMGQTMIAVQASPAGTARHDRRRRARCRQPGAAQMIPDLEDAKLMLGAVAIAAAGEE